MLDDPSPDYRVIQEPDRTRFLLSKSARKPSGTMEFANLAGLCLLPPLIVVSMGLHALVTGSFPEAWNPGLISICLILFLLGLTLLLFAFQDFRGADELILTPRTLLAAYRLWRLRWSVRVPLGQVEQFTVIRKPNSSAYHDTEPDYILRAELAQGGGKVLVTRYHRRLLLRLADELSARSKSISALEDDDIVGPGKRPVREETLIPSEVVERFERPRGSPIILESKGGSLVFTIPALPILSLGSLMTLILGCVCLGVMIYGIGMALGDWLFGNVWLDGLGLRVHRNFGIAAASLGLGCCVLMFSYWFGSVTRRRKLTVTPSRLILEEEFLSRRKCQEWSKDEIEKLGVEVEGYEPPDDVTDIVTTLRLYPRGKGPDQRPVMLLDRDSKEELEWIASTIRRTLKVPAI